MARMLAVLMVLALPATQSADAHPFTATDLARLERLSDPRISPDGRFIAYNVRSTEWEANRGVNAVWVLERTAADNVPRLIRDQENSATLPRWSHDGQWLYFLSARSGSRDRVRMEPRLRLRKINQVLRDAFFFQNPLNHRAVAPAAG